MLKTKEAIILVGGLGTRLSAVVNDRPKPMADFNGRPFLSFLLDYLQKSGVERVILSAGYKADYIKCHLGLIETNIMLTIVEENEPLGTGGAVKNALAQVQSESFFVLNGDSFCQCDLDLMEHHHQMSNAQITMLLTQVEDASAFGTVSLNGQGQLTAFEEKSPVKRQGLVNSGVYLFEKPITASFPRDNQFSLEHDFFPKVLSKTVGFTVNSPLYDIGTPASYRNACLKLG
ncbi:nucleotidyltransferase family protein [Thalassotalea euphylliae]|uniref:Galactokinase n=1 Tax=Thalassotalea euphylliae TaxID=1655234 RepID=A0A3E0UFB9_9GAMM|nr:nucleotidyltransferase family protein [Thalassotalea euphylliae]REL34825.1 galactokinase [Thalassotalea euphylliae]